MKMQHALGWQTSRILLFLSWILPVFVVDGSGVISSDTFTRCSDASSQITVTQFNFQFSKDDSTIKFSVAGTSTTTTNVRAQMNVTAYGISAYQKSFDPCGDGYNITQLCPVAKGPFAASGAVVLPADVISQIPGIAFSIPDLSGMVTLQLFTADGTALTCLKAPVGNGKTLSSSSVQAVAGAVAGGALIISGAASIAASLSVSASASAGGSATVASTSPNMGDVLLWFQAVGMNGMLSVEYPSILRSFYGNFGWPLGLGPWDGLQKNIDTFRSRTGGNLTASSLETLKNSTLSFTKSDSNLLVKRDTDNLRVRNDLSVGNQTSTVDQDASKISRVVEGIDAFVESLMVPSQNTFVSLLLIFLIVVAATAVISLICKLAIEIWHRSGKLPKKLRGLRENYWSILAGLFIRAVLILYGTWSLFCLHQIRYGDSWAATLLAACSLALFTGILLFFTVQITRIALQAKKHGENGAERLYHYKPHMRKYGFFYDQFKEKFWWFFVPCILYSFIKAFFIAFGDGHGLVQIIGCIACECVLLVFLFCTRAYDGRQANVVNGMISCVRILSLVGTLLFVDLLGFKETTKTITGIVLIILQSSLTAVLTALVIFNGIMPLLKKKKKDKAEVAKDQEEITPLEPYTASNRRSVLDESKISYKPYRDSMMSASSSVNSLNDMSGYRSRTDTAADLFKSPQIETQSVFDISVLDVARHPAQSQSLLRPRRTSDAESIVSSCIDHDDVQTDAHDDVHDRALISSHEKSPGGGLKSHPHDSDDRSIASDD